MIGRLISFHIYLATMDVHLFIESNLGLLHHIIIITTSLKEQANANINMLVHKTTKHHRVKRKRD